MVGGRDPTAHPRRGGKRDLLAAGVQPIAELEIEDWTCRALRTLSRGDQRLGRKSLLVPQGIGQDHIDTVGQILTTVINDRGPVGALIDDLTIHDRTALRI